MRSDPAPRTTDPGTIKPLLDLLDSAPFLPPDVVALAGWVAEYYACGVGEAIATAMPPRSSIESERHAHMTDNGHARILIERGARRQLLELLEDGRPLRVDAMLRKAGTLATLRNRSKRGAITEPVQS